MDNLEKSYLLLEMCLKQSNEGGLIRSGRVRKGLLEAETGGHGKCRIARVVQKQKQSVHRREPEKDVQAEEEAGDQPKQRGRTLRVEAELLPKQHGSVDHGTGNQPRVPKRQNPGKSQTRAQENQKHEISGTSEEEK